MLRGWLDGMPASPEDSDPLAGCDEPMPASDFGGHNNDTVHSHQSSVIESVKGSLKKASVTEARLRILPVYAISGAG